MKKFLENLSRFQSNINREIKFFFDKEIKGTKFPFLVKTLKNLKEFSLRPGKRIRAILINQGYFMAGGKNKKEILKASIFIELIHNFLLIHDDILDEEKFRRGRPALHRLYQKEKDEYYGISMALVAGDMMEFLGRKILSQSKFPNQYKIKAIEKLNQILISTAYGEMFEYWLKDNLKQKSVKEKDILEIYKNKTAYYTFIGPLQIGALLAGASTKSLQLLEKIGLLMGIAFQIKDDEKDMDTDKKEGQPSLLTIKTVDECRKIAEDLINQAKKEIQKAKFPLREKQFLLNLADYIKNSVP